MKTWQTRKKRTNGIKYLTWVLITGILLLALFIRLQGAKTLPSGLFRGPDA